VNQTVRKETLRKTFGRGMAPRKKLWPSGSLEASPSKRGKIRKDWWEEEGERSTSGR